MEFKAKEYVSRAYTLTILHCHFTRLLFKLYFPYHPSPFKLFNMLLASIQDKHIYIYLNQLFDFTLFLLIGTIEIIIFILSKVHYESNNFYWFT